MQKTQVEILKQVTRGFQHTTNTKLDGMFQNKL